MCAQRTQRCLALGERHANIDLGGLLPARHLYEPGGELVEWAEEFLEDELEE
jgi:hypothetical protein